MFPLNSASIDLNSDPAESKNQCINGFYWRKKTSAVHVNKLSRKKNPTSVDSKIV